MLSGIARKSSFIAAIAFAALVGYPAASHSQTPTTMGRDQIANLARLQVAIAAARDSIQAQLAKAANKKPEAQQQLRDRLRSQIEELLHHSGLTEAEYEAQTLFISTNGDARKTYDSVMVVVTGAPLPGAVIGGPERPPAVPVPAGPVGVHIGHVVNSFTGTPNEMGLLPTAIAEARIANQHATLAMRAATNLDGMKLHAGHVIHAVDPSLVEMGPGLGYGLKKAALGVASHIELAAKAEGASPNVIMHATHVATSARNTVLRADQIVALAQQIRNATSATDAAALVSQLVSLTEQVAAGFDKNGDGRVTWEEGEGGLQQMQEHVNLMLAGEKKP